MQWRTDEQTLEEVMTAEQVQKGGGWASVAKLLIMRAAEPLTYDEVLKWPISDVQAAVQDMLAAIPKHDGLDNFRRQLGGS